MNVGRRHDVGPVVDGRHRRHRRGVVGKFVAGKTLDECLRRDLPARRIAHSVVDVNVAVAVYVAGEINVDVDFVDVCVVVVVLTVGLTSKRFDVGASPVVEKPGNV